MYVKGILVRGLIPFGSLFGLNFEFSRQKKKQILLPVLGQGKNVYNSESPLIEGQPEPGNNVQSQLALLSNSPH